jgi:predicted transcriptional regulator
MDEEWMELADVAQLLGRTERQILRYAQSGKVATRRVGRRYQYRRDEVERLADAQETLDTTRRDTVSADVGRALVEVVGVQRQLIEAQRDLLAAKEEIAGLRAQLDQEQRKSARYFGIMQKLWQGKK